MDSRLSDRVTMGRVFDTSNGFQGVWHLRKRECTGGRRNDNRSKGPYGMTRHRGPGRYRVARWSTANRPISRFRQRVKRLNFPENGSFTLSAWFRGFLDNNFHEIISKAISTTDAAHNINKWKYHFSTQRLANGAFSATAQTWKYVWECATDQGISLCGRSIGERSIALRIPRKKRDVRSGIGRQADASSRY